AVRRQIVENVPLHEARRKIEHCWRGMVSRGGTPDAGECGETPLGSGLAASSRISTRSWLRPRAGEPPPFRCCRNPRPTPCALQRPPDCDTRWYVSVCL